MYHSPFLLMHFILFSLLVRPTTPVRKKSMNEWVREKTQIYVSPVPSGGSLPWKKTEIGMLPDFCTDEWEVIKQVMIFLASALLWCWWRSRLYTPGPDSAHVEPSHFLFCLFLFCFVFSWEEYVESVLRETPEYILKLSLFYWH